MRLMRIAVGLLCTTFLLVCGVGGVQGETLQDAVGYMLKTNPEIKALSHGRDARDWEVTQARGDYYPTVDLSYMHGRERRRSWGEIERTITRPHGTVLSLRQNVFHFGATMSEVSRTEARVRSQEHLVEGASENLTLAASRVYLNVLLNLDLNDLAEENLRNHERIYDQMILRKESGVDPGADLDQVLGRLSLARSNLVVTRTNMDDAKTDYLALIGRMPENLVLPVLDNVPLPGSLEEAERVALESYPILHSAEADLEARKWQHETAKRIRYPRVDLSADYEWLSDVNLPRRTEDFIVMGTVSVNLFNGLRSHARVQETRALINEAQEIMNNTERQVLQSIRLSWQAYQTAVDRVGYLEEYVAATGVTGEAFQRQWSIGRRTMFDVLDTQAEHVNARIELTRAQYDMLYAEFRVLSAMGRLVHSLGLQWPTEVATSGH